MRVLIADKLPPFVIARLEAAGCSVRLEPDLGGETLADALRAQDPEVLVVRSTKVQEAHFAAGRSLSLVIRAGAGVNTIDLAAASRGGVFVSNCPGKNAIAVAELTIGHLINLDRRIADNVAALRSGKWDKKGLGKARGLYGRTLAVLGAGRIGREVIKRARAFGMQVRVWDKFFTQDDAEELGVARCETALEACLGAHALTVHLPLNDETRNLVSTELLAALQPGAYVVNTARGGVVDEGALRVAIAERGLRAGLDVYEHEPSASATAFDDPLAQEPSIYGTHHVGASTDQASDSVAAETARIVEVYQKTGRPPNCVNIAERSPATHLLVVRHADRVGVLAGILDALRASETNIQEMENIIFTGAEAACAQIHCDKAPDDAVLAAMAADSAIFAVTVVPLEAS
ncbi:MAG: hydroxyacid dehydrogenase [Deltaproteobacteria bacterium]|nr:MAG: hydroxyacid dehydrogenase [Deltaproteobacteria bacterium]